MSTQMTVAQAMVQFRLGLRRRSPKTGTTYQTAIVRLAEYLLEVLGKPASQVLVGDITPDLIVGAVRWLAGTDLALASLLTYRTGIGAFWRFLVLEGWVEMSAQEERRMRERLRDIAPRQHKTLPTIPSEESFARLFAQARNAPDHTARHALHKARNIAVLETLRATGCRASELLGLTRGDLGADRAAMVRGKGNKDRRIFWDEQAWISLEHYLELVDLHGARDRSCPVFLRHDRAAPPGPPRPMSYEAIRHMIHTLADQAGIEEQIRPHLFRHRFGTMVLANTGNLALAQDLLGHESPKTTRIYARLSQDQLAQARAAVGVL